MPRRDVYESDAIDRDDGDPFRPGERGRASRSLFDWTKVSHALLPVAVRNRAISVDVRTDRETVAQGEQVGLRVELFNRLSFPVVLRTRSRVRWSWSVDGVQEANRVRPADGGDPTLLEFDRRERKVFERQWSGRFKEADDRWAVADPGSYEVAAWINVDDAARRGLRATTELRIE